MKNGERPIANPLVVLREEFDDWAILFDPDTGNAFGLSPTGVYVWKLLDGKHSIDEMLKTLRGDGEDVPQEAGGHLAVFVEELTTHGLAGYDVEQMDDDRGRLPPCPTGISEKVAEAMQFAYEPPKLINLSGEPAAGACCSSGTSATGDGCGCTGSCVTPSTCYSGACAASYCSDGSSANDKCMNGSSAQYQCYCGNSVSNMGYSCGGGSCDALACGGGASHI
jgi:SynChlorMet cassette protein ScmD